MEISDYEDDMLLMKKPSNLFAETKAKKPCTKKKVDNAKALAVDPLNGSTASASSQRKWILANAAVDDEEKLKAAKVRRQRKRNAVLKKVYNGEDMPDEEYAKAAKVRRQRKRNAVLKKV